MKPKRIPHPFFMGLYLHCKAFCLPLYHHSPQQQRKPQARVAQLVERDLAKVEVASSNLVSRSNKNATYSGGVFVFITLMVASRKCLSTDDEFRQVLSRIGLECGRVL
jgi:hypothetical protein